MFMKKLLTKALIFSTILVGQLFVLEEVTSAPWKNPNISNNSGTSEGVSNNKVGPNGRPMICRPANAEEDENNKIYETGYNSNAVFPTWNDQNMLGVIGRNEKAKTREEELAQLRYGETRLLVYFIPRIIDLLLKFVAPIVVVMFIYAGVQFIYAGDSDDQLESSKKFFQWAIMGTIFIVLSYSLMKSVYFIMKDDHELVCTEAPAPGGSGADGTDDDSGGVGEEAPEEVETAAGQSINECEADTIEHPELEGIKGICASTCEEGTTGYYTGEGSCPVGQCCIKSPQEASPSSSEQLEITIYEKVISYYKVNGADDVDDKEYLKNTSPPYLDEKAIDFNKEEKRSWGRLKPSEQRKMINSVNEKVFKARVDEIVKLAQHFVQTKGLAPDEGDDEPFHEEDDELEFDDTGITDTIVDTGGEWDRLSNLEEEEALKQLNAWSNSGGLQARESTEGEVSPQRLEALILQKALSYYKVNGVDRVRKNEYVKLTVPIYLGNKKANLGKRPEKSWRKLKGAQRRSILASVNRKIFESRINEVIRAAQNFVRVKKYKPDEGDDEPFHEDGGDLEFDDTGYTDAVVTTGGRWEKLNDTEKEAVLKRLNDWINAQR